MAIKFDARITGIIPRDVLLEGQERSTTAPKAPQEMRAMEKPQTLSTPERKGPQLSRSGEVPRLRQTVMQLLSELKSPGPGQLSAAQQALAAAAAYAMRRSKGARRSAIELLEAVAENVPEQAGVAKGLRHVLIAEGYLHRCDADSTLRAIRALISMLAEENG